jgi:branched-chain amino acid transport system substrate-binding protein
MTMLTSNIRAAGRRTLKLMLALLVVISCLVAPSSKASSAHQEIVVGALVSLTGEWSSLGEASQVMLAITADEVNAYLAAIGSDLRFKCLVEDTRLDPDEALRQLQNLAAQGVKIVIGPQSSAEVAMLKSYADAHGILLLSQGSTASSLAIAGDHVFRFVPDDTHEAEAMSALLWADGVRVVVPISRTDTGNEGLQIALKRIFENLGGTVVEGVGYGPETMDYSAVVQSLSAKVRQAVDQYGSPSVGIYLTAFAEVVAIFQLAQSDPILSSVPWYGSDGVALSPALINDGQAAQFAIRAGYPNPTLGLNEQARPIWEPLTDQVRAQLGRDPDAFALAAYDAFWVAALTYLVTGEANDVETVKGALGPTANLFFGATGWTALNEAGDRRYGDYDFWAVRDANGTPQWVRVARYESVPGSAGRLIRLEQ